MIDDEVMGVNDDGPQNLAVALNGVVDIDDNNEPDPENVPTPGVSTTTVCLQNGVLKVYVIDINKAIPTARPNWQIWLTPLGMTSMFSYLRDYFQYSSSKM